MALGPQTPSSGKSAAARPVARMVGGTLALSGATYSPSFATRWPTPIIGVASGRAWVRPLLSLPATLDYYGFGYVALFAFVGALAAVALTYELARSGRTVPTANHVLAGVAVSAAATAATTLVMMLNEAKAFVVFSWLYGDFTTASWEKLRLASPYVGASWVVLLLCTHRLNALQLGDDEAATLGVRVERLKIVTVVVASLATAICVALSGLIGFVGLIVPHACRLLVGPDNRVLFPVTLLFGATFLILADLGARIVLAPQELPVGIITAAVGSPFFLILLRRSGGACLNTQLSFKGVESAWVGAVVSCDLEWATAKSWRSVALTVQANRHRARGSRAAASRCGRHPLEGQRAAVGIARGARADLRLRGPAAGSASGFRRPRWLRSPAAALGLFGAESAKDRAAVSGRWNGPGSPPSARDRSANSQAANSNA